MKPLHCLACHERMPAAFRETYQRAGHVIQLGAERWYLDRDAGVWRKGKMKRKHRFDPVRPPPEHDAREGYKRSWDDDMGGPCWKITVTVSIECPMCRERETYSPRGV